MTITKERLLKIQHWRETYGADSNVMLPAEEAEELARIALASLEAEPIGAFHIADQQVDGTTDYIKDGEWPIDKGVIEVYAVPPAPVVPEEMPKGLAGQIVSLLAHNIGDKFLAQKIWNACRAALLQGSQPVSNHDELPYAQVKAVADLYALCWQSGEVVTYTPDPEKATIWLNNYSGTCVQEYVKLERLQEALAGNYPVTPDGWISCSERMPDTKTAVLVAVEFDRKGDWRMKWATYIPGHPDANDGWVIPGASWIPSHWMPLPEPPQEAK
ncbi:DUF551 domain-containing protein [Salmonella enterica subsp. enterica]|nr:DUF551 domain-containing protein [Salmonella enterica subsp. enterica]